MVSSANFTVFRIMVDHVRFPVVTFCDLLVSKSIMNEHSEVESISEFVKQFVRDCSVEGGGEVHKKQPGMCV